MTTCGDLMKPNPTCRTLTSSVRDLAKTMKMDGEGPLPIVDLKNGNRLLGIVTYRDLVVGVLAQGKDAEKTKALDVISHQKQFCRTDDSISRAITLMDQYHITALPVVDAGLHLVGTIHQGDIARKLEDPEIELDSSNVDCLMKGEDPEIRTIL
ncbi:MAG: CBS domain-containing protein [Cyanobacteria bacterium SZAS LIN-3]|nr:CBS domain-containing protein [Cyanobacteria bacterium SZAS LIN-3]